MLQLFISGHCNVLRRAFSYCYYAYSEDEEERTPFYKPGWIPVENFTKKEERNHLCPKPWRYQRPGESDVMPKWGQFSLYPGGGYVADLGYEKNVSLGIMKTLQRHGWLDRQSRSLILEFSAFNPSTDLLVVANYFYEIQPSGLKALYERIETISLYCKANNSHQFYLICLTLFNIFVVLYMGKICYSMFKQPWAFFMVLWNWVELLQLVFSVLAVVITIVRSSEAVFTIRKMRKNIFANANFQKVIAWGEAENSVSGILIFLVTIKLLRLIRYNKQVAIFSVTLKAWANSLPSFMVVFVISFVAFMHFGILVFGTGTVRYSSILKATYFQLELILGKVKKRPIEELSDTNGTFGRMFAASILLSLTVLFMNFFISALYDELCSAKSFVIPNKPYDLTDEPGSGNSGMRKAFFDNISHRLRERTGAKSRNTFTTNADKPSNKSDEKGTSFNSSRPNETSASWMGKEPLRKMAGTLKTKSPFPKVNKTYPLLDKSGLGNGRMQEKLPVIEEEIPGSDSNSREPASSWQRKGKEP